MEHIAGTVFLGIFFLISFLIYKTYQQSKWQSALFLILLLGFVIRLFVASDPYLHTWDERFHALVAKNLMQHPLKPTLYDQPVLPYQIKDWVGNHVWLTKPTLPLWCMAASMKVFGSSVYALRLPSLIISLMCVWMTFWIGRELWGVKQGLFAAYLHAIHGLGVELSGGIVSSDHVETFLLAFVQAGILFSILYVQRSQVRYSFLAGASMALAFLSKWISGFMILFVFWGFLGYKRSSVKGIIQANSMLGLGFLAVVSPWLVYIFINYPAEIQHVFQHFISPLKEGIENHSGTLFYYLDEIRIIYAELIYLPLGWMVYAYIKGSKTSELGILFYWILIPLVLFSLAEMKRHTYILVASPAFFLLTAFFFRYLKLIRKRLSIKPILVNLILACLILLPIRYSIERIKPFKNRKDKPTWMREWREIYAQENLEPGKVILVNEPHYIEAMFHFDLIAYDYLPIPEQLVSLKEKGYQIYERSANGYVAR